MKAITVSGCSNCPYLTIYTNGSDRRVDSIINGKCTHPSFSAELPAPMVNSTVFLNNTTFLNSDESVANYLITDGSPLWCPLPEL